MTEPQIDSEEESFNLRLENKRALATGVSRGIGAAFATGASLSIDGGFTA